MAKKRSGDNNTGQREADILAKDAKLQKLLKDTIKAMDEGYYWEIVVRKRGRKQEAWFVPSPKLRKNGKKSYKI